MRLKDIQQLVHISDIESRTVRSELASVRAKKEALQKQKDTLNNSLTKMRVDICDPSDTKNISTYTRHIALKNIEINHNIAHYDTIINTLTEKLRTIVREEKKLDLLTQDLLRLQKIRMDKAEEDRNDLFSSHLYHKEDKN